MSMMALYMKNYSGIKGKYWSMLQLKQTSKTLC
jgi:hypothetical protein